jgi:hypothetical protein
MPRTEVTDEGHHTVRTVLTGTVVILVLGLLLGAALGLLLIRFFDAAGLDDLARNFSGPHATERSTSR